MGLSFFFFKKCELGWLLQSLSKFCSSELKTLLIKKRKKNSVNEKSGLSAWVTFSIFQRCLFNSLIGSEGYMITTYVTVRVCICVCMCWCLCKIVYCQELVSPRPFLKFQPPCLIKPA